MIVQPTKKRRPGRPKNPVQRSALVMLAIESFAHAGYAGTSMGDVAARSGLTKASLFHHFPSKQHMYAEALETVVRDLHRLVDLGRRADGEFARRLDRLGTLVIGYLATNPLAAQLLVREMLDDNSYLQGAGAASVQSTLDATVSFLQAGMDAGAFRRQDPRHLALTIVGLHLHYFATKNVSSRLMGEDIYSPKMLSKRKAAVLAQVRALCLAAPTPKVPAKPKRSAAGAVVDSRSEGSRRARSGSAQ